MRAYVDHVMAILPFEPEAHLRLGGPPCTYVGHPLIEGASALATADPEPLRRRLAISPERPVLVVLPGSRASEVDRLMEPFGRMLEILLRGDRMPHVVIPAVEHLREQLAKRARHWPIVPEIVTGEDDKRRAFKLATAALAASGTVTLELALAGTPMVVAYRVDALAAQLRFLVKTPHFALANLVLGERAFPELMQEDCVPEKLAAAVSAALFDEAERARQKSALARLPALMHLESGTPGAAAAEIVLRYATKR